MSSEFRFDLDRAAIDLPNLLFADTQVKGEHPAAILRQVLFCSLQKVVPGIIPGALREKGAKNCSARIAQQDRAPVS